MDLYVLDRNENLLTILSNDSADTAVLCTATVHEQLNKMYQLNISVSAVSVQAQYIAQENYVMFLDLLGNWQMYIIKDVTESDGAEHTIDAVCEFASQELLDEVCNVEASGSSSSPAVLIQQMLAGTRWTMGNVDTAPVTVGSVSTLNGTVLGGLQTIMTQYGMNLTYRLVVSGNQVITRYVDLKAIAGRDVGKRFEFTKDITTISRQTITTDLKTAIIPTGVMGTDGKTPLDITGVSWTTPTYPLAKPLNQKYLEDTVGTARWGYKNADGTKRPRYIYYSNTAMTTVSDLIADAYKALMKVNFPLVNYTIDAVDLFASTGDPNLSFESVQTGDLTVVIDHEFTPDLAVNATVIGRLVDLLDPANSTIELGNYMASLTDNSVQSVISTINQTLAGFTIDTLGNGSYSELAKVDDQSFAESVGYTYIQSTEGIWTYDSPSDVAPTKMVAIKGGKLGIGKWDSIQQKWVITTFIDGNSVNATAINTGILSADLVQAGSLNITKLDTTTQATIGSVANKADTSYVNTQLTVRDGTISLKASQTDLTATTARVTTAEQKITPSAIVSTVSNSTLCATAPITSIDDTDIGILYATAWVYAVNASCHGGGRTVSSLTNDNLQYTFIGTGVNLYVIKINTGGIVEVFIDGVSKGLFDTYASVTAYQALLYSVTNLTCGTHTIKINITGTKNASSTGTMCYFDYMNILNNTAINTSNIGSTIQQSASDIEIGFNGINNVIDMTANGIQVSDAGGSAVTLDGRISYPVQPVFARNCPATNSDMSIASINTPRLYPSKYGNGILIEELCMNMIAYSEVDTAVPTLNAFSASSGATMAMSATQHIQGTKSMQYTKTAVGETYYQLGVQVANNKNGCVAGQAYTFSAYIYVPSASGFTLGDIILQFYTHNGGAYTSFNSNPIVAFDTWQRVSVTHTVVSSDDMVFLRIREANASTTNKVFYVDALQFEAHAYATTFSIGSGKTANETLDIPVTGLLSNTAGTVEFLLTPQTPAGTEFNDFTWGNPGADGFLLRRNATSGYQAEFYSPTAIDIISAGTLVQGTAYRILFRWDATGCALFVNGVKIGTSISKFVATANTYAQLGYRSGKPQGDAIYDDVRFSATARTDAEIALYNTAIPLPMDVKTTGMLSFDVDTHMDIYDFGFMASHDDGSYTLMSADGFKRVIAGGAGHPYHYLMYTAEQELSATTIDWQTATITVPDEFIGTDWTCVGVCSRFAWTLAPNTNMMVTDVSADRISDTQLTVTALVNCGYVFDWDVRVTYFIIA
jgi:phage minor structural protein